MKPVFQIVRMAIAFSSKYPLEENSLNDELRGSGFIVPTTERYTVRASEDGAQSTAMKWTRGETEVYYEPTRPFLTAEGRAPSQVVETFSLVDKISKRLLGENPEQKQKYGELYVVARVMGAKFPLRAMREKRDDLTKAMSELLGTDVQRFSEVFCCGVNDEGPTPLNQVLDWTHITVEPFVVNPTYYFVRIVIRNHDVEVVRKFGDNLESILIRIVEGVECD